MLMLMLVQVKLVILHALEQNSDALLRHLCLECSLLTWIADAPAEVVLPRPEASSEVRSPRQAWLSPQDKILQVAYFHHSCGSPKLIKCCSFQMPAQQQSGNPG